MIGKQGKNFTTAKIFKKVCKTLFVTVTILSPNFLLNLINPDFLGAQKIGLDKSSYNEPYNKNG